MPTKPLLGFSTGTMSELGIPLNQRLELMLEIGCNAVEIGYARKERFFDEPLEKVDLTLLNKFSHVSLHAPGSRFKFNNSPESREVLDTIERIHKLHPFDLVVFHPDSFENFSVFDDYSFPVGIENMDDKKVSFQTAETLAPVFQKHPKFGFCLDLNHCFVNDNSMELANDLFAKLGGRLKEVHLSGFEILHDPLFKTKQAEFITTLPIADYPVIIESMMSSIEDVEKEYNYILEFL